MKSFKLEIITPEGKIFETPVTKLFLRGASGDLAVMTDHIPFVTTIKPCECRIDMEDGKHKSFELTGGILSVLKDKAVVMTYDI